MFDYRAVLPAVPLAFEVQNPPMFFRRTPHIARIELIPGVDCFL